MFKYIQKYDYDGLNIQKLYDLSKGNALFLQHFSLLRCLDAHRGCVNSVSWDDSGQFLLSGSDDQNLVISSPWSGRILRKIKTGHRANIFSAKFIPFSNNRKIISCSGDGTIIFTDLNSVDSEEYQDGGRFMCHIGTCYDVVTISGDPHTFLSCGEDGTVRWFDLRLKTSCSAPSCTEDILLNLHRAVTAIAVNPISLYKLAVSTQDSIIHIYDRRMLGTKAQDSFCSESSTALLMRLRPDNLEGKKHRITSLKYNSLGNQILASYSSDYMYLFDVENTDGKRFECVSELDSFKHDSEPTLKRLRLRGDWSDTGPQAMPEAEVVNPTDSSDVGQARPALHSTLMQRMTDILSRMLNSGQSDNRESSQSVNREDNQSDNRESSQSINREINQSVNREGGQSDNRERGQINDEQVREIDDGCGQNTDGESHQVNDRENDTGNYTNISQTGDVERDQNNWMVGSQSDSRDSVLISAKDNELISEKSSHIDGRICCQNEKEVNSNINISDVGQHNNVRSKTIVSDTTHNNNDTNSQENNSDNIKNIDKSKNEDSNPMNNLSSSCITESISGKNSQKVGDQIDVDTNLSFQEASHSDAESISESRDFYQGETESFLKDGSENFQKDHIEIFQKSESEILQNNETESFVNVKSESFQKPDFKFFQKDKIESYQNDKDVNVSNFVELCVVPDSNNTDTVNDCNYMFNNSEVSNSRDRVTDISDSFTDSDVVMEWCGDETRNDESFSGSDIVKSKEVSISTDIMKSGELSANQIVTIRKADQASATCEKKILDGPDSILKDGPSSGLKSGPSWDPDNGSLCDRNKILCTLCSSKTKASNCNAESQDRVVCETCILDDPTEGSQDLAGDLLTPTNPCLVKESENFYSKNKKSDCDIRNVNNLYRKTSENVSSLENLKCTIEPDENAGRTIEMDYINNDSAMSVCESMEVESDPILESEMDPSLILENASILNFESSRNSHHEKGGKASWIFKNRSENTAEREVLNQSTNESQCLKNQNLCKIGSNTVDIEEKFGDLDKRLITPDSFKPDSDNFPEVSGEFSNKIKCQKASQFCDKNYLYKSENNSFSQNENFAENNYFSRNENILNTGDSYVDNAEKKDVQNIVNDVGNLNGNNFNTNNQNVGIENDGNMASSSTENVFNVKTCSNNVRNNVANIKRENSANIGNKNVNQNDANIETDISIENENTANVEVAASSENENTANVEIADSSENKNTANVEIAASSENKNTANVEIAAINKNPASSENVNTANVKIAASSENENAASSENENAANSTAEESRSRNEQANVNRDSDSNRFGRHSFAMSRLVNRALNRRRLEKLRREREEHPTVERSVPFGKQIQIFKGHRNARTMIKEACFWGENHVISGSDCGRVFVWDKKSGEIVMLWEADRHVVNCVQPHPTLPVIATSGIDYDVKVWAPISDYSIFDQKTADEISKRNETLLAETRDTVTVPATFMIRMLATLNQLRHDRNIRNQSNNAGNEDDSMSD